MFIILTGDLYQPMPSCHSPKLMGDNVEPSLFLRPLPETSSTNERSTLVNGTDHLHTVPLSITSPVSQQVNPFPTCTCTPESSPERSPTEEDPTGTNKFSKDLIGDVYKVMMSPCQ